jgi:hypothetical protein
MRKLRFNIASLLGVVLLVAVGLGALREANDTWDSGLFTLTLVVLLVSVLLAVHRGGARRAFWIGFALFGCCYLALSVVQPTESRLVTTKALAYLDSRLSAESPGAISVAFHLSGSGAPRNQVRSVAFTPDGTKLAASSRGVVKLWDVATGRLLGGWSGTTDNRIRIGHSLFALLAAWFGGLLSRRLCQE